MNLLDDARELQFIDIDSDRVPCTFLIKLIDRTYRLTFLYNEIGDFFTIDLSIAAAGNDILLVYSEVIRYGKPLFEAFNDERYPLPVIIPLCLTGDEIDAITYDNFGDQVKLYMFPRFGADHP